MRVYKLKLRHGSAEFEAEGDQKFVEKHLQNFKPLLNLPSTEAPKAIRRARVASAKKRPGRKPRKIAKASKPALPSYPPEAVVSLESFLNQAKPKGQPATAVALGLHHTKQFKSTSFTNKDVSSAAKAVGFKFTNLALSLMSAAKQGKIRKIKKGIWKISSQAPKPVRKARSARRKKAAVKKGKVPF